MNTAAPDEGGHGKMPKYEDWGPGFGEVGTRKLMRPVMPPELDMPLACKRIC